MTDLQAAATKQDIQMLFDSMQDMEERLVKRVDEKIDSRMTQAENRMEVLIEEAEERFLATGHEKISIHDDKLENHEGRIVRVEGVVGV